MGGGLKGQDAYTGRILPVAHALRAEGFEASEDGTGRGTPIVPVQPEVMSFKPGQSEAAGGTFVTHGYAPTLQAVNNGSTAVPAVAVPVQQPFSIMPMNSGKDYKARRTDVAQPIMAGGPVGGNQGGDFVVNPQPVAIAFTAKDHGGDAVEGISPTLRAGGHTGSHANAEVMPAVAFDMRGREGGAMPEGPHDTANIRAASGGSSRSYAASQAWGVRRLTPTECERLQGFPDGWTAIPWRGKGAEDCPDGPRYKALGNSFAVNVATWIGERIEAVRAAEVNGAKP